MRTLTNKQVGELSLAILKIKAAKRGMEIYPEKFQAWATGTAELIGCSTDALLSFEGAFVLPAPGASMRHEA